MPAVLFVPVRLLQITFSSHTVRKLFLLHPWLRVQLERDDGSLWLEKRPAQKHCQLPLRAPPAELVPDLGRCWLHICYQKQLPTCQLTENPFCPFPQLLLSHRRWLHLHTVHSRCILQAFTGTQREWRHIGRSPSQNASMRQAQIICLCLSSLFIETSRGDPQPAQRLCCSISRPLYLVSFPNSEKEHFFLAN